ncbi:MAG: chaperone modulator CbpM [Ferruginibacter sp.]
MASTARIAATEFCSYHNISIDFITALGDFEMIEIVREKRTLFIPYSQLQQLEKMVRLHRDLHVNAEALHTILHLLQQVQQKESELQQVRNLLAFYEDNG